MGAKVAWTLNVETDSLNLLYPNIDVDEVESLEYIFWAKKLLIRKSINNYVPKDVLTLYLRRLICDPPSPL